MKALKEFLLDSSLAERIKVPIRVVVHHTKLTPEEIVVMKKGDSERLFPEAPMDCELHAGEETIARGKIVKKRGGYYFKVLETGGDES